MRKGDKGKWFIGMLNISVFFFFQMEIHVCLVYFFNVGNLRTCFYTEFFIFVRFLYMIIFVSFCIVHVDE